MPRIYGIDIASIVHGATRGQLYAGTLIRTINKVPINYTFEGISGADEESRNSQALSTSAVNQITIIANSITPKTTPLIQDSIRLNSKDYLVMSVDTDPAEATHTCVVSPK